MKATALTVINGIKSVTMWLHFHGFQTKLSRAIWANRAKKMQRAINAEIENGSTLCGQPRQQCSIVFTF